MKARAQSARPSPPASRLDPALERIIRALAEANARRDYAARIRESQTKA